MESADAGGESAAKRGEGADPARVAISCCKLGEGAVGGQDVFVIFFSPFFTFLSLFSTLPFILFSFYAIGFSGMTSLLFSQYCSA